MRVACIGLSHKTASSEIRERLAMSESQKIDCINHLSEMGIKEVVIISTCSRFEIYISSKEEHVYDKLDMVRDYLVLHYGHVTVKNHLYFFVGSNCIFHLFKVTAGLDSIVVGEDQILGQVKDALLLSQDLGAAKKLTNKLFREAITVAKAIKTEYKISEHPLSISFIAVKLLNQMLGDIRDLKVMIVGIGEMGILALQNVLDEGVKAVWMSNRSHDKLLNLLEDYPSVKEFEYENRYDLLGDMDIVISATASPHVIFSKDHMKARNKPLIMMDIAMPRDIDARVIELDDIKLLNVDDLQKLSNENTKKREMLAIQAETMIEKEVQKFEHWMISSKVDPLIQVLHERNSKIVAETEDYLFRKIDLAEKDKKLLSKMLQSAVKRTTRDMVVNLKQLDSEDEVEKVLGVLDKLIGSDI